MKSRARLAAFSAIFFICEGLAFADMLYLKSGQRIPGTYQGGATGYVQFRLANGVVQNFDLSTVQWIYISQRAATPAQPSNSSTSQPSNANPASRSTTGQETAGQASMVPSNTGSDVPQSQAQSALDFHNAKRRDVGAPPLQWSPQLAAYAQKWANHLANDNNCQLTHTDDNRYGENLFGGSGMPYTALDAAQDWYKEITDYKYGTLTEANWYPTGHYTQMVWSNTKLIGMGQANCSGGGNVFAAEYYPPGNYMGQKPY